MARAGGRRHAQRGVDAATTGAEKVGAAAPCLAPVGARRGVAES